MEAISQVFSTLAHSPHEASTHYHFVDPRFAGILAEDFAIAYALRCWARRHGRGSYRAPREGPPGRSVDHRDHCQGYGGYRPAACSLRAVVVDVDMDTLNRIAERLRVE